ncbi:MAG TPA: hypothetical protein VF816_10390 [Rhodocyclaceae bacterium]
MDTLEITPPYRNCPWYLALVIGLFVPYLTVMLHAKLAPGLDATIAAVLYAVVLAATLLLVVGLWTLQTSVRLVAGEAPVLETRRLLFGGRLASTRRTPLAGSAWARTVLADHLLVVQLGTPTHETTVACLPYSDENLRAAEQLGERVAALLQVENKGYVRAG